MRYTEGMADDAHWLLTMDWAGRTWRISDVAISVATDSGDTYTYSAGMDDPEVDESMDDPAEGTASGVSVSMDVLFPASVAALVAIGHDPSTMRGELARWVVGTTWENRRVLVAGIVADPEIGDPSESVALTLEAAPWLEESEVPTAEEAVIGANWGDNMILSLAPEDFGLTYPRIYGRPGRVDTSIASVGWVTGSEAVWVDHQNTPDGSTGNRGNLSMVIAGHHVSATSVYLNNADFSDGRRFLVRNTHDDDGHPVAVIGWYYSKAASDDEWVYSVTGTYTYGASPVWGLGANAADIDPSYHVNPQEFRRHFVGWYDVDNPSKGGKTNADGTVMRNAADVIADLLLQSSAGIDRGRFATAAAALSRFNLDFQVNERVRPWEFLRTHILPILPLSLVMLPTGIAPIVWPYGAPASAAVARLNTTIDPGLERVSRVTYDRQKLVNDITVNYAKSVRTGEYCAAARLRGDVVSSADTATGYADPYCIASQRRYRDGQGRALVVSASIDTDVIYDTTSALAVAQWQAAAYSLARRTVDYEGSERRYGGIERGSVVLLTDVRMSFSDVVAIVIGVRIVSAGRVKLRLMLQTDPSRDLVRA